VPSEAVGDNYQSGLFARKSTKVGLFKAETGTGLSIQLRI